MTTAEQEAVAQGLLELMMREMPQAEDINLHGLRRVSEGYSRENWVFEGSWTERGQAVHLPLILRRDPVGSLLETERRTEFDVLTPLGNSTLPVPRALWLDEDGRLLGRPSLVMVREQGTVDWFVLNGTRPLEERLGLARGLLDLLGQIHQTDWHALGLDQVLEDPGPAASLAELTHWERQLRDSQLEPHPELDLVHAWLYDNAPESQATVLVHGDYKPGNALLHEGEISAMLDWELAHLGDPLEDLGWITNPYRAREHQIPDHWERKDIIDHYRAQTGFVVDDFELYWWNVFSCYKLSVIILNGISAFVGGQFDVIFQPPMALFRVMYDLMDEAESEVRHAARRQ